MGTGSYLITNIPQNVLNMWNNISTQVSKIHTFLDALIPKKSIVHIVALREKCNVYHHVNERRFPPRR